MTYQLYKIPEPLLIALVGATLVAIFVALPLLTRRVPFLRSSDVNTEFVIRMQAPLFTMTALVLAFTLVEAVNNFRRVDAQVTAEASQINQLDRLLTRYGSEDAGRIRPLLRAYARSIVQDEWPQMLKGAASPRTGTLHTPVSIAILALKPESGRETVIYTEMLKLLEAIAVSRDTRLDNVQIGLPAIYWEVITFAVLVLLIVSATIEPTAYRRAVVGAQMAVLGAFIAFAFVMDAPFQGQTAVTSEAIAKVVAVMEKRQQ
jgi:hypothetical protein